MDPSPSNRPAQAIALAAATAAPAALQAFEPQFIHRALAGAMFESDEPVTSIRQLAQRAGLNVDRVREVVADPAACSWIIAHAAGIARVGLSACYARLFHKAMTADNPQWMSLFLKRFDPDFARADSPTVVHNTQINNFQKYTDAELLAYVSQEKRKRLGAEVQVAG